MTTVSEEAGPTTLTPCAESGSDHTGTQIEEPFHVLPMDAYCSMMAASAKEQYERSSSKLSASQSDVSQQHVLGALTMFVHDEDWSGPVRP